MKIFIIGAGNLGSAFAHIFSLHHQVVLYDNNPQLISEINTRHTNTHYLPGIRLSETIIATTDISLVKDCTLIIIAVPSRAMLAVAQTLKPYYHKQYIISASKGLSPQGEVLTTLLAEALHCPKRFIIALSGPCIAKELAHHKPTKVMLGGDLKTTRMIAKQLTIPCFTFECTRDREGIQLLGFYKNLIAMIVGICEGLELGHNFESALVAKAYQNFYRNNRKSFSTPDLFMSPAGLGDLYVTAVSPHSRNRTFGYYLGKGMTTSSALKKIGQVVEGYESLQLLLSLKKKSGIDTPLITLLHAFTQQKLPREVMKEKLIAYISLN